MGRVGRLAARCAVVLAVGLTVAVVVVLLGGFLGTHWAPLRALDLAATDALHDLVTRNGVLREMLTGVTDLGGTGMLLWLLTVGVVWLLVRDQPRPAAYVAMTAVGAVLVTTVLDHVVVPALPSGFSPPGDATASLVSYGVLLLVLGPVLATGARRAVAAGAVVLVVANGVARMALGVHGLVGLVAGWLVGLLWLALTVVAFRRWRQDVSGVPNGSLPGDVPPEDADRLRPVPIRTRPGLPHPWRRVAVLLAGWAVLAGLLVGLGNLVVGQDDTSPLLRWDQSLADWLAERRGPALSEALRQVARLGGTPLIMTGFLVVAPLAVAVFRTWRPVLFLGVALLGETMLYRVVATTVGRARPDTRMNPNLDASTSFPSGHVAAAVVLYTATAMLVFAATRGWWRWIVAGLAVLVPGLVALQRLYWGMHYLSDAVAAVVLALLWTGIAWRVTEPAAGGDARGSAADRGVRRPGMRRAARGTPAKENMLRGGSDDSVP